MNKIVILGDSLAFNRPDNLKDELRWPQLLAVKYPDVCVENRARGANTTNSLIREDLRKLNKGDSIIVQLGVVDCAPRLFSKIEGKILARLPSFLRQTIIKYAKKYRTQSNKRCYVGLNKFTENLSKFFESTKHYKLIYIKILPPGSKFLSSNPEAIHSINQYNKAIESLSFKFKHVDLIDFTGVSIDNYTLEDGYHLNEEGHKLVAEYLDRAFENGNSMIKA